MEHGKSGQIGHHVIYLVGVVCKAEAGSALAHFLVAIHALVRTLVHRLATPKTVQVSSRYNTGSRQRNELK